MFIRLICVFLLNGFVFASDYCGQPVPHDIAQPGYNKMIDNAFADPKSSSGGGFSGGNNQEMPSLQGQVVYVPPGAALPIFLDRPLGSGFSRIGEISYAYVQGTGFGIPQGTVAEITVLMVEPAGRGFARAGRLQLSANRLILPNGQSIWLKGLVVNAQGQTALKGQSTGSRVWHSVGKIALGAGIGAASGAGIGYGANGNVGTGAIIGTVVGTVIGGVWAGATKGQDVLLPSGTQFYLSVTEGTQAYL